MFSFAYPYLLFLLLIIPVVIGIYILARIHRRRKIRRFGNPAVVASLMPEVSRYKPVIRLTFVCIALAAIIFALARPWGGVNNQETSREGIEIVIAVDASNSMLASATGDEKGMDRMRTAKLILERLINRLSNDRVGLVAYAGDAYTLIPVTNDYVSAKAFLNSIDPSLIPHQGTNIGAAVALAEHSFSEKGDIGKAIILLTDADELENPAGTVDEVRQASKRGIQTDVIGIGSQPVTIPSANNGRMINDETGEVVRTALNEDLAIEIAKAGNGIYVNASNDNAIDELTKQLGKLKHAALESSFLVSHDELYYPFVILAIVILIAEFIMSDKRNKWLERINFFSKDSGKTAVLVLILSFGALASCNKAPEKGGPDSGNEKISRRDSLLSVYSLPKERDLILNGNMAYRTENYEAADSSYTAALKVNGKSPVANLNHGLTVTRNIINAEMATAEGALPDSIMGPMLDEARNAFNASSQAYLEKGNVSSKAFYNLGNISFTQKQYDEAIREYKEALRLNPDDDNARRNLRIAQLQKNENNQNQQQQQQQDQQQQQQEQQQQQDRKNINEQTSEQILNAAERKENIRRAKMQTEKQPGTPKSGRSNKQW